MLINIVMRKRILIVDDDKNFLFSLADGLEKYKDRFEIVMSDSVEKAMNVLRNSSVDLVISDLRMRGGDGLQLLSFIAREFPEIPFILMTAYGSPQVREKVREMGAVGYLEKPLTIQEVVKAIEEAFEFSRDTEGYVKNFSPISFAQLIKLEERTCVMQVTNSDNKTGFLGFKRGLLVYAELDNLKGEEAALEIFKWDNPKIVLLKEEAKEFNVNTSLETLILRALQEKDEKEEGVVKNEEKIKQKEGTMPRPYEAIVESFKEIPGYKAAAIFNVNGEELTFHALKEPEKLKKYFLQMTSLFVAGDKAAEKTGAGGMDFIQTDSDLGKFLARRGEKFIVMLMLEEDGNIALAKDALAEAAEKL